MKGIQVNSNGGQHPFPLRNDNEKENNHLQNLIILFSRTTGPISTKLGTNHPCVKGAFFYK